MPRDSNQPVYFDCSVCGECCSSWNIPIEGEKARALLQKDWVRERLKRARRELVAVSAELYRIPLTDENVCVFLGEDRRCLVEAHEGLALKPAECQRFPFAGVRMPDGGIRHDTSAACKKIAETLLLAFQPILPRPDEPSVLERAETPDPDTEPFPLRVRLDLFRKMDWTDYERWLACLRTVFLRDDLSSDAALAHAARLLRQWPRQNPRDPVPGFRLPPRVADMLVILFLRKPYGSWSWLELLRGQRYQDSRIFGFQVDLRARGRVLWNPALDHHVNAYLYNLLGRKVLPARGASLDGMLGMAAVACLLVRWYAVTLAWFREASRVETADVTMAIRLVERYYSGHQPRFLKFFTAPWQGGLMKRLLLG